ncbi:hypothetical protein [Mycobacterium mantenii]|uniref:hypothetical protein n=1 Tax=Mycobacterium mantenii TaxID=560555 RepID=UPI000A890360|nr:hypothetical protein [Mycobacterium mantenii]
MSSINRFPVHSDEALLPAELMELLEERAFLIGRLKALRYELCSPFARPIGPRK